MAILNVILANTNTIMMPPYENKQTDK